MTKYFHLLFTTDWCCSSTSVCFNRSCLPFWAVCRDIAAAQRRVPAGRRGQSDPYSSEESALCRRSDKDGMVNKSVWHMSTIGCLRCPKASWFSPFAGPVRWLCGSSVTTQSTLEESWTVAAGNSGPPEEIQQQNSMFFMMIIIISRRSNSMKSTHWSSHVTWARNMTSSASSLLGLSGCSLKICTLDW